MPPEINGILEERIQSLHDLMKTKFAHVQKQLDAINVRLVSRDEVESLVDRIERLEVFEREMHIWCRGVDRAVWLLGLVGGVALTVTTALVIAWATGYLLPPPPVP